MVRQFDFSTARAAYCARLYGTTLPGPQWKMMTLQLTGVRHPVWLRPGTSDWRVLHQVFVAEEYNPGSEAHETALAHFYEDVLGRSKVPVIIDCGANVGMASIWYAQRYPSARIIAVEPEPENFRILAMNAANYPNITPIQGGISDRQTRASLVNAGDDPWAWETKESGETGDVAMFTIPGLLADVPNARPMIVKIDIEGGEVEMFRSNAEWTRQAALVVFEAHDRRFVWRGTFHAIVSSMVDRPRDYIQQGENTFAFSHDLMSKSTPGTETAGRQPLE
jgi:FkbM family methyltransferase